MITEPTLPVPPPVPVPDPRSSGCAPDFAGMQEVVGGLVVPARAPRHVASALETSRELIRHSYYRYEFGTVAVTHALLALERALADHFAAPVGGHRAEHRAAEHQPAGHQPAEHRAAGEEPLRGLVERAVGTGLVGTEPARALADALLLRDRLTRGEVTSAAVSPSRAAALVGAVFDAVALFLPRPAAPPASLAGPGGAHPDERLARLWEEHRRAAFPASFRGVHIGGVELVLLDADLAAVVLRELRGRLDGEGIATLWRCITDLGKVAPLIGEEYCAAYFARLRVIAGLVAARHTPRAT
ncbi:hypothetical protein OH807_39585 [Kitasatospora sp. NBC_01560]|uniref:hypothetical protein n=1 Tax=Kitasatospora sp. NBC_01560 TaxID=2975965 RepID=UPI0038669444